MYGHHIRQEHNVGLAQGIHYGNNNFMYNCKPQLIRSISSWYLHVADVNDIAQLTPKQQVEEAHEKVKADWIRAGTCEWLPQRSEFRKWVKMEKPYSFLWIHGIRETSEQRTRYIMKLTDE